MKKLLCLILSVLVLLSFTGCVEYDSAPYGNLQDDDDLEEYDFLHEYDYLQDYGYLQDYEYIEDEDEDVQPTTKPDVVNVGYRNAVDLMMRTFSNDFSKEELKYMFPSQCWTWFEKEKGKNLDDIYEDFSGRMAANWEKTKELVGQDAAIKYEFLDLKEFVGQDYDALKATITEKYGIDEVSYGRCYEVRIKRATVGSLKEDIRSQLYHVLEIDEKWYVAEVLTTMPVA